jgi:glutathione peroxidase
MSPHRPSQCQATVAVAAPPSPGRYFKAFAARILLLAASLQSLPSLAADHCPEVLQHTFNSLTTGKPQDLCQFRGKVVLVVNTASYCGHTDQYGPLETLYRDYKDRGLVVLGFPSNDFGNQEPDNNKQIARFCRLTYGIEFPMFEKSRVVGGQHNALFAELHRRTGQAPRWNFHKYLIDRDGARVMSFESGIAPGDPHLMRQLRRMLDSGKSPIRSS